MVSNGSTRRTDPTQPRILIVEDSPVFRTQVKRVLERSGLPRVEEAQQVSDALKVLADQDKPVDLILLDIELPDLDGVQACRLIKADPRWQDVPVLMVTGHRESKLLADALAAGAMDFLTKPLERNVFMARVRSALRLKREIDARRDREQRLLKMTRKLEEANRQLLELTGIDELSGLANRRKFNQAFDQEWLRCRREERPLTLIMADIDRFKSYNDHYGHQQGDVCIRQVAQVLDAAARRAGDLACRWGGEEFAIILPGVGCRQGKLLAEQLRRRVEDLAIEHPGGGPGRRVTVSLGIAAMVPEDELGPPDLLDAADSALYAAKQKGRNRVESVERPGKASTPGDVSLPPRAP